MSNDGSMKSQMEEMTENIVQEAVDTLRIEGRLREVVANAVELAPETVIWCAARLGLLRINEA